MSKDIEKVFCGAEILYQEAGHYSSTEEMNGLYDRRLINELSCYMVENRDRLPITTENVKTAEGMKIVLSVNLISDEELRRLKEIQFRYYQAFPEEKEIDYLKLSEKFIHKEG